MDIGWKAVSAGAALISGFVANKAVDAIWKFGFHKDHPHEDDFTEPLRDVLVFAVVSAVVGSVVNQLVMRKTARWYGLDKKAATDKKAKA
ncbi:MAG: DUF4235 domain-containing protein [Ancrocorticia sp.]|jgi:hypothetical protein|nr:DUF4235 domain-containing protein [Ancrocorticia sp.]MCI1895874.1 DUF4235 domain-containing protein [Ancrocorticia sp.]MCI1932533.1 DUF4235 domain-containing protein [Ancrocorticia sp.]MCI1963715.1 DUF4235 domain-containing protein [Ancrocorticia sp.]MCI2003044.1 DUF4235 domain-containing protein [Ancrocorticia sp.]